jgi:hypothetical protein
MPDSITISTSLPTLTLTALENHRNGCKRSRAFILQEISLRGLELAKADSTYPPIADFGGDNEGSVPVTFSLPKGSAKALSTVARKRRDWSRAKLVRAFVVDAVSKGWIKDIH